MDRFETIAKVATSLTEVFHLLDSAFENPEIILNRRPPRDDAWTMAEHLEHVSLVNHFLLIIIRKGVARGVTRAASLPIPEGESDLDALAAIGNPDSFPWLPPPHMIPTGSAALPEVRERLRVQRDECLSLLASMGRGEGALHAVRLSVHSLGKIDMYQWLYFLAQHGKYHLRFLEKLRTS